MEIEEDNIIKSILNLLEQNQIAQSIEQLLLIERVNKSQLEGFIDSQILKCIFKHYIQEIEEIEQKFKKYTAVQINEYDCLLTIIERLTQISDKRLSVLIIKSNIKDLMSKLVTIQHITFNLNVFSTLSSLAKTVPEIFHNQFILTLQRSLLQKCQNPPKRLEYFLEIFHNMKDNSTNYQIDAYFYINFLKMQFQNTKLTRQSIILVIETLEYLIRFEENTENTTIKNTFEVVIEQMYPRLSLDYNICSMSIDECDTDIQFRFFSLINLFITYRYKPTLLFIAKNISEIKNILFNFKKKRIPLINVSIILEIISSSISEQSEDALSMIDYLLGWDQFQKVLDDLTRDNRRQNQNQSDIFLARKIKEYICDILINMLNKNQDRITDYFINEYLIGQLVDLSNFLDSKRRQIGIEQVVKALRYIQKQQPEKFIIDIESNNQIVDESKETEDLEYQFAPYKSNKIILSSLSDLFEVTQLPYDTNKIVPTYYIKMQQLSNNIKLKMQKLFRGKLPKSLSQYVDQYEQSSNGSNKKTSQEKQQNGDEWEDISDEDQDNVTLEGFNILDYEFIEEDD